MTGRLDQYILRAEQSRHRGMHMGKEKGIVKDIKDQDAFVSVQRTAQCDNCESKGACQIGGDREMVIQVRNDLHARDGDMVEISLPSYSVLKMGLLMYIFPAVALILGAYAGGALSGDPSSSDFLSVIGGISAAAVSFLILRKVDRSMKKRPEYQPRMTRILVSAASPSRSDDSR